MKGMDSIVQSWIDRLLVWMGLSNQTADSIDRWIILLVIILLAVSVDLLFRGILLRVIRKVVARTKATWDDIIFNEKLMRRISNIVTPILIHVLLPIAFSSEGGTSRALYLILNKAVDIYLIISILRFVNAFLRALFELAEQRPDWQGKPIKGFMQTGQVIATCVAAILVISILIDKSPAILLTGIGASAAVMMLIFKDSILGLVAGVQLSVNNMLKVGDWIYMPKQGVDGVVEEVALTIVKVRQWDNTLSMLPPYLLVSESFENWQAMRNSGGRRVKRSLQIDLSSIRFSSEEELLALQANPNLQPAIKELHPRTIEGTPLTNLDLFMHYMNRYLDAHERVNHRMMVLVRQLQPTQWGLPVEFYFFSSNVNWVPYELLQAEVISHAAALAPLFGLRIFQYPLSQDLPQTAERSKE